MNPEVSLEDSGQKRAKAKTKSLRSQERGTWEGRGRARKPHVMRTEEEAGGRMGRN